MAIDPNTLKHQRLALVRPSEYPCPRCGRRTKDRAGVCRNCQAAKIPDIRKLSSEHLVGLMAQIREELQRRQSEIAAALKGDA
jgi:hypothetical protein